MSGTRDRALAKLSAVGLTEYEAKCFVALTRMSEGTAREVSEVADIPRSRVYDVAESLHDRGLLEVEHDSPQTFRAVSVGMAETLLRTEFLADLAEAREALTDLETAPDRGGSSGVWSVTGRTNVVERGRELIYEADRDLRAVFSGDALIEEACLGALSDAADQGVDVAVGSPDAERQAALADHLGEACIEQPPPGVGDGLAAANLARALLVDGEAALVGTFGEQRVPGVRDETAVWGRGQQNGLVVTLGLFLGVPADARAEGSPAVDAHE